MQLRSQLVRLNQEVDGLLATQSSQYTQYLLQLYKLDPNKSKENRKLHQLNSQMRIRISAKSPHSGANQIALTEKLIDFEEQVNNVADRDDSSKFLSMIQSGLRDANCLPNRQQQDNGLMQSICPSGCNLETYNKILEFREDRIEIEKNIKSKSERAEVLEIQLNSSKSSMHKESDNLETLERQISEFEIEKLKELNKLFISCVMNKNDYQKLISEGDNLLLFTDHQYESLKKRSMEISEMTEAKNLKISELKSRRIEKQKGIRDLKIQLANVEKETKEMILNKFGKNIEISTVFGLEDMTIKIKDSYSELETWKAQYWKLKGISKEIVKSYKIKQNEVSKKETEVINNIIVLKQAESESSKKTTLKSRELEENKLENLRGQIHGKQSDINKLRAQIVLQRNQIDKLKQEAGIMRRKDMILH